MITGEIKAQVDRVWDAFWSGGISNSLEVIEQFTYLLFIKRLDEIHSLREAKANRTGTPIEAPVFTPAQQHFRWSVFKNLGDAGELYKVIADEVFPFMKDMGAAESAFAKHMRDARFTLPPEKAGLLARVVDMIDGIQMEDRDTKGDLYEYMLSKLSEAGQNGQFRTPRHIIKMMVSMVQPTPDDLICDPACGTAGFLVAAAEYLYDTQHTEIFACEEWKAAYAGPMFHGFDFDSTMLRIAAMNMMLHGVEHPVIENRDSLSDSHAEVMERYSLILANPPFAGSLDYDSIAKDLQQTVKTKKTELLFLALFLRLLRAGGRAAVIVPDGVLFGSSKAHKSLRAELVENHHLQAVVSLPSGVFKPYAGVSTAILFFTKTGVGGTKDVWFYDMQADGYSLDDKRTPLNGNGDHKHENDNLPDVIKRFHDPKGEGKRSRTDQSFLVPKAEITENDYDLSINRYKEIVYEEIEYDPPAVILDELDALEDEIKVGLDKLRGMLKGD